jgi:ATP-binding cassette subfamily F protein uup
MQFLQHFLFTPQEQQSYVYKLSGGERRRLYLCTVLMQNPNFLVLDEPTNDLDIVTLQILEEYLRNFKGCVIVVSHDRYFMDKVVDHLLVFQGQGDIRDFPGNYSQYREWQEEKERREREAAAGRTAVAAAQGTPKQKGAERTDGRTHEEKNRLTYMEKKEFAALTTEIEALETEKKEIETQLCGGTQSVEEITAQSKRLAQINDALEEKELRWLELSEKTE